MRVNVYHEELTLEAEIVWTEPRPGIRYCGLRIFQKSAPALHHTPDDDDRSAVTFWVGSLAGARQFVGALLAAVTAKGAEPLKEVGIMTWCGTHRVFVRLIAGRSYPSGREFCGVCGNAVQSYEPVQAVYGEAR